MKPDYVHRTMEDFKKLFPEGLSGNDINGRGVTERSQPKTFFWHPAEHNPFHELQDAVISHQRQAPEIENAYSRDADRGPRPVERNPDPVQKSPQEWSDLVREFALQTDADQIGFTPVLPAYIYEGYDIPYPNLIMIAVAMDHDRLSTAPSSIDNIAAAEEIAIKYNTASRSARKICNFILEAGYSVKAFPGPMATALNMIPAAIQAGIGELGKHGSMINRKYGSSFRLSAVATDMPLAFDQEEIFGADEFCASCQICTKACPPEAISSEKQMVRGNEKWYTDFDKCIPYFGETFSCGICLAVCPWSRPGISEKLIQKLARRRERLATE
ncbi:MAG: 4Fe-4S dicluster domain-containing protein [Rhizobiales bacterium]|nr:4Fe-4S dicluster domain-containing protein [Hyphomicrobiales bacterium]